MVVLKRFCLKLLYIIALFYEVKMEICASKLLIAVYYNGSESENALIEPGQSERLHLNCSINATTSTEWDTIHSIALYHSRNNMNYRLVATLDAAIDEVVVDRSYKSGNGRGNISSISETFLSFEWDYPQYDMEGIYKCEVQGVLISGENKTCVNYGQAFSSKIQKEKCLTKINIEVVPYYANSRSDQIGPLTAKSLVVNCSIDGMRLKDDEYVGFIYMFHTNDPAIVIGPTVAVVGTNFTYYKEDKGKGKGVISNTSESYLSVVWPSPHVENAGLYSCESQVRSLSGKTRSCLVDADIISVKKCHEAFTISFQFIDDEPVTKGPQIYLIPGSTRRLGVRCTFDFMNSMITDGLDKLDTLTLLRSEIKSYDFKTVASINSTSQKVKIFDAGEVLGTGAILNSANSYIYVQWEYPDYEIAGTYTCEASGTSMVGKPQKCSSAANIYTKEKKDKPCLTLLNIYAVSFKGKVNRTQNSSVKIEIGSTKTLQINCSINVKMIPTLAVLNSLILLRSKVSSSDYQEVASINPVNGVTVKDGGSFARGNISSQGESFLYVEWAYPGQEMAGTYKCEARVTRKVRKPDTCSSTMDVSISTMSLKTLYMLQRLTLIKTIQSLDAHQRFQLEINKTKNLKDSPAKATPVETPLDGEPFEFMSPPPHYHHSETQYFLSEHVKVSIYDKNNKACLKHGGHLAEIHDQDEFKNVKYMLRSYRKEEIQISGSDQAHEGSYKYAGSKDKEVKYFAFAKDEPTGNKWENCLFLKYTEDDWYMHDDVCVSNCKNKPCRFLCERNHTM